MKLIVGLGNPGKEYVTTRHNAGFLALDAFCEDEDGAWKKDEKRKAEICKLTIGDEDVVLAKPTTFMNNSGEAVAALTSFYKVKTEEILVVHDELDIEPGQIRFKAQGGDAGHNGVSSILERLGTDKIARLRLGIGRPSGDNRQPTTDYVLGELSPEDAPNVLDTSSAMRDWIEGGLEKAMNKWNQKS